VWRSLLFVNPHKKNENVAKRYELNTDLLTATRLTEPELSAGQCMQQQGEHFDKSHMHQQFDLIEAQDLS
jgi:hypothetical protein